MSKSSFRQKILLISTGIIVCLALLEIVMRLAGFTLLMMQKQRNDQVFRSGETFRIMCIGESTTAMGGDFSYPAQLERILNESSCGIRFSVINAGLINAKSSNVADQLEKNMARYHPHMVVSMVGINDEGEYALPGRQSFWARVRKFVLSLRVYKLFQSIVRHANAKFFSKHHVVIQQPSVADHSDAVSQARVLSQKGDWDGVERILLYEIQNNPGNARAYLGLGMAYKVQRRIQDAEKYLLQAIDVDPRNPEGYFELGILYRNESQSGFYEKSVEMFTKLVSLEPNNPWYAMELGCLYRSGNEFHKAEPMFYRALELDPGILRAYIELGWMARLGKKYDKGIAAIEKGLVVFPSESKLYGELALLYRESDQSEKEAQCVKKAQELERAILRRDTLVSYYRIKSILQKWQVPWVAMQYPTRSLATLQKLVGSHNGVIFVDNSLNFQSALSRGRYDDYFCDLFAGDFGHCTPLGNKMIAENLAGTIMREYFKKSCL